MFRDTSSTELDDDDDEQAEANGQGNEKPRWTREKHSDDAKFDDRPERNVDLLFDPKDRQDPDSSPSIGDRFPARFLVRPTQWIEHGVQIQLDAIDALDRCARVRFEVDHRFVFFGIRGQTGQFHLLDRLLATPVEMRLGEENGVRGQGIGEAFRDVQSIDFGTTPSVVGISALTEVDQFQQVFVQLGEAELRHRAVVLDADRTTEVRIEDVDRRLVEDQRRKGQPVVDRKVVIRSRVDAKRGQFTGVAQQLALLQQI